MRVSEIYLSVQGEGPRCGYPTVFVRFGGCNLRCPGWPCDTQHAIDPAYREEWQKQTPEEVLEEIAKTAGGRAVNVCFTGGEPFLQKQSELDELILGIKRYMPGAVLECFSNGTLEYTAAALQYVNFVLDWKLPGSGEKSFDHTRNLNFSRLGSGNAVKFTIKTLEDLDVAEDTYFGIGQTNLHVQWFYGRVWDAEMTEAELVETVLKRGLPWRHTMQVHNYIWDRSQRGI